MGAKIAIIQHFLLLLQQKFFFYEKRTSSSGENAEACAAIALYIL